MKVICARSGVSYFTQGETYAAILEDDSHRFGFVFSVYDNDGERWYFRQNEDGLHCKANADFEVVR